MLRVTVELVPHGVEAAARRLGTLTIANDRTGTPDRGNYTVRLEDAESGRISDAAVKGFLRQELTAFHLALLALNAALRRWYRPAKSRDDWSKTIEQ